MGVMNKRVRTAGAVGVMRKRVRTAGGVAVTKRVCGCNNEQLCQNCRSCGCDEEGVWV